MDVNGVYKPTYNWGGHIVLTGMILQIVSGTWNRETELCKARNLSPYISPAVSPAFTPMDGTVTIEENMIWIRWFWMISLQFADSQPEKPRIPRFLCQRAPLADANVRVLLISQLTWTSCGQKNMGCTFRLMLVRKPLRLPRKLEVSFKTPLRSSIQLIMCISYY